MEWKRFPVPAFDYSALKDRAFEPPAPVSDAEATRIAEAALAGEHAVAGGYAVEPSTALLESLKFRGTYSQMILCALPGPGAQLLGRSYAWFNQRAFVLDRNAPDAETLYCWRTPRPMNTLLGPETGVVLDRAVIYLLSGRVLGDHTRGNRVMIDQEWSPGDGRAGFRVIAACDDGNDNFHDTCLELSWQA